MDESGQVWMIYMKKFWFQKTLDIFDLWCCNLCRVKDLQLLTGIPIAPPICHLQMRLMYTLVFWDSRVSGCSFCQAKLCKLFFNIDTSLDAVTLKLQCFLQSLPPTLGKLYSAYRIVASRSTSRLVTTPCY